MRTVDATTATRKFGELLDSLASEGSVTITRYGRAIAELRPVKPTSVRSGEVVIPLNPQAGRDELLRRINRG